MSRGCMNALSLTAACRPHRDETRATPALVASTRDAFADEVGADVQVDVRTTTRREGTFGIVVVPPTPEAPVLLYLHGMWASPEDSCSFFERAAAEAALVCPRGNAPAEKGGAWRGAFVEKKRAIDAALDVARSAGTLAARNGIAMGFSSGAALALELALSEPGRWSGLVLMSMKLHLDPTKLKSAGVQRVALAAGELDGTHGALLAQEKSLRAAGVDARFFTLGKVGHHFATDMETRMVEVLAWVRGA